MSIKNQKLYEYLNTPLPPLEATKKFLRGYCGDADSIEEIKEAIARSVNRNPRPVLRGLTGIEDLIANPPDDILLVELVALEANWGLENPTPEASLLWLKEMAEHIRDILGEKQPPRTN